MIQAKVDLSQGDKFNGYYLPTRMFIIELFIMVKDKKWKFSNKEGLAKS